MYVQILQKYIHVNLGGLFVILMSLLKVVICGFSHSNYTLIFTSSFVLAIFMIFLKRVPRSYELQVLQNPNLSL